MNSTHRKRLFTILLSLLLTISMLPAGVFADIAEGSEDQDQVVTEQSDQDSDQAETPAPEQPTDVATDSDDTGGGSEGQDQVVTEQSDQDSGQDETPAPEQPTDIVEGSNDNTDAVEEAEEDTAEDQSYDFEMDGKKWVIAGDASADVEDEKTWDAMFADSKFTGNWAEDLVMVARSQIGYKESNKNFAISEDNDRKGYTRYGAWAGEPYADWSPLFVSFCLNYANVDMPYYKDDFDKWIADLEKNKMLVDADGYVPRSGDLVFYDLNKDGDVDAVGIVESYGEDKGIIETIEGDYKDAVTEREVKTSDSTIAGYGILPENPKVSDEAKTEQEEQNDIPQTINSQIINNFRKMLNAKGTRDGESGGEGESESEETSDQMLDFIPPGTLTLVHADGSAINENSPAHPREKVEFAIAIAEFKNGLQFDMTEMILKIPAGLEAPTQDITGTSTVTVRDVDGSIYQLPNTYTIGADGYIRYTWNKNHKVIRDGKEIDVYKLALRAEDFNYNLSFEMTIGSDSDDVTFTDQISFPVDRSVSLSVEKAISGIPSLSQSQAQEMVFGLFAADGVTPIKDANGKDITFTRDDMTGSLADASITITGLVSTEIDSDGNRVYPAVFIVRETGHPDIPGYSFVETDPNVVTELRVEIPAGGSENANLKNRYTRDKGKLTVKKSFPSDSYWNSDNLSDTQKKNITFTIKDSNNNTVRSGNLKENFTNGVWVINDLPTGDYTVTETAKINGFTRTTTYYVRTGQETSTGTANTDTVTTPSVTVTSNGDPEVEFSNSYEEQKGDLTVTKTFSGDNLTDAEKNGITFEVTGPDPSMPKTLHYSDFENGKYTFENIRIGSYKVKETNRNPDSTKYTVSSTYKVNTGSTNDLPSNEQVSVSVTSNKESEVDFFNTYTEKGKLTITKFIDGDYWTDENQATRRTKIRSGVTYKVYKMVNGVRGEEYLTIPLTAFSGTNNELGSYTIDDIPPGDYEIVEIVSDGGEIANTTRTTKVTVNGGTEQTSETAGFSVVKGGETTVAYENDYTKKKGKIKLEKAVVINGQTITDPKNELSEDQQKAIKFTITGKDAYDNDVSIEVTLYDILNHQNGVDADGYIELFYSKTNYTVKETGANIGSYIRVTTAELDGQSTSSNNVSVIIGDSPNQTHTVKYTNNYTDSGFLKINKTVTGLTASEEKELKEKYLYFTVFDTSDPARPIVRDTANGILKLGEPNDTPAMFKLAEMVEGISIPAGTYVVIEHNMVYKPDYYDYNTYNRQEINGEITTGAKSADTAVTVGNDKYVYYYNEYTRPGPGDGVRVTKTVLLEGYESGTFTPEDIRDFENRVKSNIRFNFYEGTSATGTPYASYNYQELQDNPPMLPIGTWTVKETGYDVVGFNHSIQFTVRGATVSPITSEKDTVTFTLARDSRVRIDVINGYTPYGTLVVKKKFDNDSEIKASDLTTTQRRNIKFKVTGYSSVGFDPDNLSNSTVIWPPEGQSQLGQFTYADMTADENRVMSKTFNKVPTGIYVVEETGGNITNYTLITTYEPDGDGVTVPFGGTGTQTVINKYVRNRGNLEIYKTFEGPLRPSEDKNKVKFTVSGPEWSTPQTFYYSDMENGYKKFENIATGTYTIKEENANYDFFERTTTVQVNEGTVAPYNESSGVTASVPNGGKATVRIKNEYKETGALIIDKEIDDSTCLTKLNLTEEQRKAVIFTVKRVGEGGALETVKTITYDDIYKAKLADPEQGGYRFLVLPGDYIVEESNADFEGYSRVTTATVTANNTSTQVSGESVTVPTIIKFKEASVAFKNKYTEKGNLTIKKNVTGLTLDNDQKDAIKFTVSGPDPTMPQTITYAQILAKGGEYTFENLVAGQYTVVETIDDEENVFYGETRTTSVTVGSVTEPNTTVTFNVTKNGQTVTYNNAYKNSDRLLVQKEIGKAPTGYIEKDEDGDGTKTLYPFWKFNLHITNLEPSTTDNGSTDLIDCDEALKDLFKIATGDDLVAINAKDPDFDATDANKLISSPTGQTTAKVTVVEDYSNGKIKFSITGVTADTAKNNDLTYYLIPKDEEALKTLNANNAANVSGKPNVLHKDFSDYVEYKALPRDTDIAQTNVVPYWYDKQVVLKTPLNYDVDTYHLVDEEGNVVDYALYEIIINPERMKLSTDGYIDVTDTFSTNQSVDITSITVKRYDPATHESSDTIEGDVKTKDLSGNTINLKLRDETCFRVTYKSFVLYTNSQVGQHVDLWNEVKVAGYGQRIEPVIIPQSAGGGSVYQIKLLKYQNGNLDNTLKGAKFQMYLSLADAQADKAAHDADPSVGYPNSIGEYTTDENGEILITEYTYKGHTHHVYADKNNPITYCFIESEAPEGYELIDYIVQVRLADSGEHELPTYSAPYWIYLPSDTVGIKDKPYETKINLGAHKIFNTNGGNIKLNTGDFSFTLKALDNAPMPKAATQGKITVSNDKDGNAIFGTIKYDTEDVITRNDDGDVTSTQKIFQYQVNEVLPEGVTAENPEKDGIIYDTKTYFVYVKVAIENGALTVKEVTVNDGNKVTKIDPVDSLETDPDPIIVDGQETPGVPDTIDAYFTDVTNEYTAKGEATLKVKKELGEGDTWPEGKSAVFTLKAHEDNPDAPMPTAAGGNTVTLTSAEVGYFGKIEYPLSSAGKTYKYTITETSGFGSGWTNATPITATVVVDADTGTGQLTTEVTYDPKDFTAINDYDAKGEATLNIKKVVKASGKTVTWPWPAGKSAEFTLTAETPGAPMPTATDGDKVTLTSEEVGEFGTIEYPLTSAGQEYEYLIRETKGFGDGDGWTDADPIKVTVVVGSDTGNGQLKTTVTYDPEDFTATNDYDATGSIPLKGTKKFKYGLFGADDPNEPRKKNFTFSVYPKSNFDTATSTHDLNDLAGVEQLQAAKVGTASTADEDATISTDGTTATASFDFKFKAKGGTTFDKDQLEYTLADILEGGHKNEAGYWTKEFYYVVVEDIPGSAVKKTVDGKTFYYDKTADIKYDPTVYEVEITVTDNGRGSLIVTKNVKVDGNVVPNSSGADYKFGFRNEKIYTKLKLTKVIDQQVAQDTEGELTNVTFVFKISYTDPVLGKPVGRTVSVQFDPKTGAANPNPAIVDKIPIDSEVKVTEVYAADYKCDGNPTQDAKLTVDTDNGMKIFTVSFSNNRQGNTTGSGVINTVDKNTFRITNRQDSTGTNKPPKAPR